jgi:3-hydroxyisobutyrate dehydrogenase-like beta-hydroxyacid dehydrogenase
MQADQESLPTVGILYPGEMGSALAKVLRRAGLRVVTTLAERGLRTHRYCQGAGVEVLDSLADVARAADVVLAVVPPAAAVEVAERFAACAPAAPRRRYVDLNSIAPATTDDVGRILARAGVDFVDGAVHGLASHVPERAAVYLSGPKAAAVAAFLGRCLRVKLLSGPTGTASAFRMLISGLTKGVIALFLEMGVAAQRAGLLRELLACYAESYPGVMDVVGRTLPTYPLHAARRADELRELEQMLGGFGLRPCMVAGARDLIEEMGRLGLAARHPEKGLHDWSVPEIVEEAHARGLLRLDGTP